MRSKSDSTWTKRDQAALPRLRFPEFDGSWKREALGDVATFRSGGTPSKQNEAYWNGDIPWVTAASMYSTVLDSSELMITRLAVEDGAPIVAEGTMLILVRGSMLYNRVPIGITVKEVSFNQDVKALTIKSGVRSEFLLQEMIAFEDRIPIDKTGIGAGKIETDELKQLEIFVPIESEQQKVADCLSSLDASIDAESRKLDALKVHKQSLMQQLFPAAGERAPRLRFAGFRKAWSNAKLGELSVVVRGGSPRPIDSYMTDADDGLNWLKIGDVDKASKYIERTREKVIPAALGKTRQIHPGDLILSNSMSFGRPFISKIVACIHDGWLAITEIQKQVDQEFLYYFLSSEVSQAYFQTLAAGSGVKNLNADSIKQLPLSFPDQAEQQQITSCLSFLDELLEKQSSKIALLEQHKRGLMQGLFPSSRMQVP